MKKKFLSLSLALALSAGLSAPALAAGPTFTDVPADLWAYAAIEEMASKGIMGGVGDNKFAPNSTVSYAQFATMVARSFYSDKIGAAGENWYDAPVKAVTDAGVLNGVNFSAAEGVNRYEMAQMLYNVIQDQKGAEAIDFDTKAIADWNNIPDNYKTAVSYCYAKGILAGTDSIGTFNGTLTMTRAQGAVVLDRAIDLCESNGSSDVESKPEQKPSKPATGVEVEPYKPNTAFRMLTESEKKELGANNGYLMDAEELYGSFTCLTFTGLDYKTVEFSVKAADKVNITIVASNNKYDDATVLSTTEKFQKGDTKKYELSVDGFSRLGINMTMVYGDVYIYDIYFK